MVKVGINTKGIEKEMQRLTKKLGKQQAREAVTIVAEQVLKKARKRAPLRFGGLRDSDLVVDKGKNSVTFGFNKEYAAVMDLGTKVSIIRPIRAKALAIPISKRAKRGSVPLNSKPKLRTKKPKKRNAKTRNAKGLLNPAAKTKASKKKVDWIFVKSVKPRKVSRFAKRGPNLYFSATVKGQVRSGAFLKKLRIVAKKRFLK